jgi:hypothetical protein
VVDASSYRSERARFMEMWGKDDKDGRATTRVYIPEEPTTYLRVRAMTSDDVG